MRIIRARLEQFALSKSEYVEFHGDDYTNKLHSQTNNQLTHKHIPTNLTYVQMMLFVPVCIEIPGDWK